MSTTPQQLTELLQNRFGELLESNVLALDEVTIEVSKNNLMEVCQALQSEADLAFTQLIDLCGVDTQLTAKLNGPQMMQPMKDTAAVLIKL